MAARVLIIEDDRTVSGVVHAYLRGAGLDPRVVEDGMAGLDTWRLWSPDLVVLDLMLPTLDGLEVLRRVRSSGDATPVVVLSAGGDSENCVVGLEVGADDYLAKPFSPRELLLRVQGLLGRDERVHRPRLLPRQIVRGPLHLDTAASLATVRGTLLSLTQREFKLLVFLVDHPGETFSKRELLRRVWGWDFGDTSTVAVHVHRLREKVEHDPSAPRLVVTVRGTGYRFATDEELHEA